MSLLDDLQPLRPTPLADAARRGDPRTLQQVFARTVVYVPCDEAGSWRTITWGGQTWLVCYDTHEGLFAVESGGFEAGVEHSQLPGSQLREYARDDVGILLRCGRDRHDAYPVAYPTVPLHHDFDLS